MVEVISGLADSIAGFRAKGEVSKKDYTEVVEPEVDELVRRTGKINFLLLLDTTIGNYTPGAAFKDFLLGLKHLSKWHKMAIVSEQEGVRKFTDFISSVIPGEARGFSKSQFEEAQTWLLA